MKVLVLGWSSLARRRVIPALAAVSGAGVDIASESQQPEHPAGVTGRTFSSYDDALRQSDAAAVYVSTRNHDHYRLAVAALRSGRHAIVDKPAALGVAPVRDMVGVARAARRLVAEATVYPWHPQVARLRAIVDEHGPATRVTATFSFPPLAGANFRLRADWGGGALWDLGAYAVTPGRLFFGEPAERVSAIVERPEAGGVDTAFSVLAGYSGGRTLVGHYGMTTAYVNRLEVTGPRFSLALDRAFTTTPTSAGRITGSVDLRPLAFDVEPADAFALFLADAFASIASGDHRAFEDAMLRDAEALDQLRNSRT